MQLFIRLHAGVLCGRLAWLSLFINVCTINAFTNNGGGGMCGQGNLKAYFHPVLSDSLLALNGVRVRTILTSTLFK